MKELIEFTLDNRNSNKSYNLAKAYEQQNHNAPAHTYYLRAAENSTDDLLAYQALIRASFCCKKQGSRDITEKSLLENAVILLPERPEAYYFLSLLYEKKQEWQNCYIYANLGLQFDKYKKFKPLEEIPEYQGNYLLIFQKAVASWWWGKGKESRELFDLLLNEYYFFMDERHKEAIQTNIKKLNK